ncbi:MAG: NfeD family protein [Calditrichia bacterium]
MEAWQVWILAAIIFLIIEIFTPGFLFACFSFGGLCSSLVAFLDLGFKVQLLTFAAGTLLFFFGVRPFYQKYFSRFDDHRETGIKALVGKSYPVIETIDNKVGTGRIQIGSESWRARTDTPQLIPVGQQVTVIRIEGSTAYVIQKEEEK